MSSSIDAAAIVRRAFMIHGVALLTGLVALFVVVDPTGGDGMFFVGLALGWLLGVPLSLARLRPWAVFVGGLVVGWLVVLLGVAPPHGLPRTVFEALGIVWVGVQFGAASSYALLTPRLDVAALWLPLGLHVAAAVTWLNQHGAVDTWRGDKLAIWDAPSAGLVVLGVLFFVLLLAARQRVSRARWASDGIRVDGARIDGGGRGRVVLLGALLAVVVLAVSPFLLRTRAGCDDCSTAQPTTDATTTTSSVPSPPSSPLDGDRVWATAQRLLRAVGDVAGAVAVFGTLVVVAGVASLPLLRRRRLRALEHPAASLPPTERVRRRFQRAVVALGEAGVVVDDALAAPCGLLHAVVDVDDAEAPRGLVDAVAVWEQVRFGGRGLPDDAEARMARAMGEVVDWATARRSAWQAVTSAFRLPSLTP